MRRGGEPAAPEDGQLSSLSLDRLEEQIGELAAHIHAATCRWLSLVAEFDRREGWAEWGCRSCADWLSLRCGIGLGAAREQVRVARRLEGLPLVREAFARGKLSFSKVRAISRVADPGHEPELLELALHATAAQLERIVRAYGRAAAADVGRANLAHSARHLSWSWDDDGSLMLRGRLPAEEGALLLRALEAAREALAPEPPADVAEAEATRGGGVSAETRDDPAGGAGAPLRTGAGRPRSNVDALVLIAEGSLAAASSGRSGGDRYQLVVHADAGLGR